MIRIFLFIFIYFSSAYSFSVFVDESEKLDINQILTKENSFINSKGISASIEHTNKPIWIKQTLTNDTKDSKSYIVNLRPTIIQDVTFYKIFDEEIKSFENLDRKFLAINVPKNSKVDIYAKFYHSDSLVIFQTFDTPMGFIYKYESKLVENLIFLTILLVIIIYTLVLYYHTKKTYFIYYVLYVLSLGLGFATYTVVWPIFFSVEPSFLFLNLSAVVMYCTSLLFILTITNYTTNFPNHKKLINFVFISIGLYVIVTILDFQKDLTSNLMRFNMILNVFVILWILSKSLKKVKIAKHLLIGWGGYTFAVIINNLLHFGLLPYNFFTTNAFEFGTIFENFVFAYALGLQLKMINDERVKLLNEKHQKESFYQAQSKFALAGQVLFQIEHEWRRPLSYIPAITSTLQSKIFTNQNIEAKELNEKLVQIDDTVKNIRDTMDEFKKFYTPDKIKKNINLYDVIINTIEYFKKVSISTNFILDTNMQQIDMESFEADWKHIVLNLLQNSIDHANSKEQTKIFIELFKYNNTLEFIYIDNSGGTNSPNMVFEPFYSNKENKGIGLYMVKYIVTNRLAGEIFATNYNKGLKTTIKINL